MSGEPHTGEPRWIGEAPKDIKLKGCLFAADRMQGAPLIVLLEGTEDMFLPVFSTEAKLKAHVKHLQRLLKLGGSYKIVQIDHPDEFCLSVWETGIRIMLDPIVINDHHTRWYEVLREGDAIKYMKLESGGS